MKVIVCQRGAGFSSERKPIEHATLERVKIGDQVEVDAWTIDIHDMDELVRVLDPRHRIATDRVLGTGWMRARTAGTVEAIRWSSAGTGSSTSIVVLQIGATRQPLWTDAYCSDDGVPRWQRVLTGLLDRGRNVKNALRTGLLNRGGNER